jgi:arylsulfatase A-like enzyme
MNRRQFAATLAARALAQGKKPPNVLFIAVDDLNDWVQNFGGNPQSVTPNMARLGARSVRFQRAYCNAPMCNPSRASLMTGLRPSTTGVYTNTDTWRDGAPDAVTLPEYFLNHGYRVLGCGKLYHNSQPDYHAFHEYLPEKHTEAEARAEAVRTPAKSAQAHFDWGPIDVTDEEMEDYRYVRYTSEVLAKKHAQPFFMACGFKKPHLPWFVPKKYFDKFPVQDIKLPTHLPNDLDDVPPSAILKGGLADHARVTKNDEWQQAIRGYLAAIHFTDANLGRVLDALEKGPNAGDTIVVFWGDHGWQLGEKNQWRKFTLWERSCRAPLMISAPGIANRAADCRRVVEFVDLYPTLLELCGLPANSGLEGRSLLPLLKDPQRAWDGAGITSDGADKISIRTERWRYGRFPDGEELYDENQDPHEWKNLAHRPEAMTAEQKKVRDQLAARLPKSPNRTKPRDFTRLRQEEQNRLRGTPRDGFVKG